MKRVRSVVLSLVVLATPSTALAEPAAAQQLFYEARALMAKGQYAEACPKLEESLRLDQGMGTQFNLADCNEHLGKIATAWASYLEVAAEAKASNQAERERVARKRAAALEPRLPKLVVEVPSSSPGLEVKRDGIVVGGASYGTAIPVDPGTHLVSVTAPGKLPWQTRVAAVEGRIARVSVPRDLTPAPTAVATTPAPVAPAPTPQVAAPPPSPPATATLTSAPLEASYFPPPETGERGAAQRTLGWIVAGTGVVGLGVGGAFGVASLSNRDESRKMCNGDLCNAKGAELRTDAIRDGNISTVAMVAGGASVALGLVLVFTAPSGAAEKSDAARTTFHAAPSVAQNGAGFSFGGTFR